jgi:LPS sulfotransferase NodH
LEKNTNTTSSASAPASKARSPLLFHFFRMYMRILHSCLATFGFGIWFLFYVVKIPILVVYVRVSMFLDNIFHAKYRRTEIKQPVFIISHPRTGSTFLHTILTQTEEFANFKRWELISPALIGRKIIQRSKIMQIIMFLLIDLRSMPYRYKRVFKNRKEGHNTRETIADRSARLKKRQGLIGHEEEVLFMNILDTQFLTAVTPLGFAKRGFPEICFNDEQSHQENSVLFLKNCFKRQIYFTGKKQILAKMNYSVFRVKTLLKVFPDAKFIYLVRSPLETIPSHLSLHRKAVDRNFGLENISPDKLKQYSKLRYHYNLEHYKRFEELKKNDVIPKSQLLDITYDSLKSDLWGTIQQIKDFANLQFSAELEDKLRAQAEEQSSYKRPHRNLSLEDFELTEEKIRADFDFVFRRYGFE